MQGLINEIQKALDARARGGSLTSSRKMIHAALETYSDELDNMDSSVRDCLEGVVEVSKGRPFAMFCLHAINLIDGPSADQLSCGDISDALGLNVSTIQRRARRCPGASRYGNSWVFKNNSGTWEYFGKITPRPR